jgi:hypothetical protein
VELLAREPEERHAKIDTIEAKDPLDVAVTPPDREPLCVNRSGEERPGPNEVDVDGGRIAVDDLFEKGRGQKEVHCDEVQKLNRQDRRADHAKPAHNRHPRREFRDGMRWA